jgi:malate permease and related proteins
MLALFIDVVLPVFLVAGMGYLLERRLHPPIAALNQTALFVLMPALIFTSLLPVNFASDEPLRITAFAFLLALAMLVVAFAIIRVLRLDRVTGSAFMLTAAFPNLGNYGLPVMLLAFGQPGLAAGTILLAVQSLYGLALGVFIASSGSASLARSARELARQPILLAVIAALLVNLADLELPRFLVSAIALPAQAAIPLMLLVLGMNIAGTRGIQDPRLVGIAVTTRLVLGPLVGFLLVTALGIEGVARSVMIVGSAMPTAVYTILTATQFNARPRLVSDVVVASTVLSIVTVTAVLAIVTGRFSFP